MFIYVCLLLLLLFFWGGGGGGGVCEGEEKRVRDID